MVCVARKNNKILCTNRLEIKTMFMVFGLPEKKPLIDDW